MLWETTTFSVTVTALSVTQKIIPSFFYASNKYKELNSRGRILYPDFTSENFSEFWLSQIIQYIGPG